MTIDLSQTFSKKGILIGACLLAADYIIYSLFYAYVDPRIWEDATHHKYILYINLLIGVVVAFIVVRREEKQKDLANHMQDFSEFKTNIPLALGLSIFSIGTFILYNILKAKLFNSNVIPAFIDNNLYVHSASNWLNALNSMLYPLLITFIFQGFLLNGLANEIGFKKSNIATSVFYGLWGGDIIGGTIYNLFLNLIYRKTKNIFYTGLVSAIVNLVFIAAYIAKEEIWLLKPDYPTYNEEIIKGLLITLAMAPIAIKVVRQATKSE